MKKICSIAMSIILLAGCDLFSGQPSELNTGEKSTTDHFDYITTEMHKTWSEKIIEMIPKLDLPSKYEADFSLDINMTIPEIGAINGLLSSKSKNDIGDPKNLKSEGSINIKGEFIPEESDMEIIDSLSAEPESINDIDEQPQYELLNDENELLTDENEILSDYPTEIPYEPYTYQQPKIYGGSGEIILLMKWLNDKMFLSLDKMDFNLEDPAMPISKETFEEYIGKWYGDNLENLEKLLSQNGIPANFSQLKQGININDLFNIKEPIKIALEDLHFWKMVEPLETENDLVRFKVELDKEATKKGLSAMLKAVMEITVSKSNIPEDMKKQIDNDFKAVEKDVHKFIDEFTVEGILAISQINSEYFIFSGTMTYQNEPVNIEIKWLENEKVLVGTDGTDKVSFELNKDKFILKENANTVLSGENSDTVFKLQIFEGPNFDEEIIIVDLTKNKNVYNGTLNFIDEELLINVEDLSLIKNNIQGKFSLTVEEMQLGTVSLKYLINEISSVNIEEPNNYQSFEELMTQIQTAMMGIMQGMYGIPDDMPYEMYGEDFDPTLLEDFDPMLLEDFDSENFEDFDPAMLEDFDPSIIENSEPTTSENVEPILLDDLEVDNSKTTDIN